ncbi:MAG: GNAT family N-acetyltransferase [Chloroflexota bacterium]|nr:GNAT family N-acetyltransferase [Chloroflexota bacterium]MDE3102609.1 GNAT family N-acetyltransferase [Chloroflexota bacterium]
MEYEVIGSPEPRLLRQIISLHMEALGDSSTLTRFGERILAVIYRSLAESRIGFLVLAREGERVAGFVFACTDKDRLLRTVVMHRPAQLITAAAAALLRDPRLTWSAIETALYERRARLPTRAELLVIAVAPEQRSKGIGTRLLDVLRGELARRGIVEYAVTVHRSMEDANRFYLKNGLRLDRRFRLYGVEWNAYVDTGSPSRGSRAP